jgi:hypothetical protein
LIGYILYVLKFERWKLWQMIFCQNLD